MYLCVVPFQNRKSFIIVNTDIQAVIILIKISVHVIFRYSFANKNKDGFRKCLERQLLFGNLMNDKTDVA